jgi:hypothetical protein
VTSCFSSPAQRSPDALTRRFWAATSVVDSASRSLRSRAFRNVPSGESDESSVEVIEVLDPCHPLYGRTFRVIRRVDRGSGNFSPSYEVEYLQNHSLLVPISVTEAYNKNANQTKLSIEALRDLVLTVECLESHEHGSEGSVGSAAASSAASDCRGCRRGSGGGLS